MATPHPRDADSDFFARLARWESAGRAATAFDQALNRPIAQPGPPFQARLYEALVEHLLDWLELPRSTGAAAWEWRALYRFADEADPFYFTEASIHRLLGQWPALSAAQQETLASVLGGYLHLRREGFPASNPSALLTAAEGHRWGQVFPARWAWCCLDVLQRAGKLTVSSTAGYRALARYADGLLEPARTPEALRRWQAACWGAAGFGEDGGDAASPHRADFVAAAFGGAFAPLGLDGPCRELPQCERCPLQDGCRWHHEPAGAHPGVAEIRALALRRRIDALGSDQLLQGLLGLPEEARATLQRALAGISLRQLAARSPRELEQWGTDVGLEPGQLHLLFELCRRFNEERMVVGVAFQSPAEIFRHFRMRLRDLKQEQFIVVLLDNKKRYLGDRVITQGTLDASPVHPREVFNAAIRDSASAILIVHNHPSGDPNPSKDDVQVTRHLMEAGRLVGIPVLDHVIIADERFTSLLELGLLEG